MVGGRSTLSNNLALQVDDPSTSTNESTWRRGQHIYMVDHVNVDAMGNPTGMVLRNPYGSYLTLTDFTRIYFCVGGAGTWEILSRGARPAASARCATLLVMSTEDAIERHVTLAKYDNPLHARDDAGGRRALSVELPRLSILVEKLAGVATQETRVFDADICRIGSHESNDVVLEDETVSRFHCLWHHARGRRVAHHGPGLHQRHAALGREGAGGGARRGGRRLRSATRSCG